MYVFICPKIYIPRALSKKVATRDVLLLLDIINTSQ